MNAAISSWREAYNEKVADSQCRDITSREPGGAFNPVIVERMACADVPTRLLTSRLSPRSRKNKKMGTAVGLAGAN